MFALALARFRKAAGLAQLLHLSLLSCYPSASSPLEAWLHYKHWVEPHDIPQDATADDSQKPGVQHIPRERNLSLEAYQAKYEGRLPVILEGAYDEAACMQKDWLEVELLRPFGKESIGFGTFDNGDKQSLATTLEFFVSNIGRSSKNQWAYIQDEFFLSRHPKLLETCPTRPPLLRREDHFGLLPEVLVPRDAYLLWGGKYSASSLHVDPYNWTGTNVVLRGKKRWRLLPPGGHDRLLGAYRSQCGFALDCVKYQAHGSLFVPRGKLPKGLPPIWEAVAGPGDMLVIPTGWWHEALNTARETVAIGSQVISHRGGSWSAVAEVLKFYSSQKHQWQWDGLPEPPTHPEDLRVEAAEQLFSRFASILPPELVEAGRRKIEDNERQLAVDRSKKRSNEL